MIPLYFPFTWISSAELEAVKIFFKRLVLYHPSKISFDMEKFEQKPDDCLDVRFPVTGDESELALALSKYHNWADLHQGSSLLTLKSDIQEIPFFNDASVSQITRDIRQRKAEVKDRVAESHQQDELVFNARLFLHMAQTYDQINYQLHKDFRKIENMQQGLMDALSGKSQDAHDDDIDGQRFSDIDRDLFMGPQRLEAWAQLFQHESNYSGLFITCSPSLFDAVMEKCQTAEKILDIHFPSHFEASEDDVNQLQMQLMRYFDRVAISSWPIETEDPMVELGKQTDSSRFRLRVFVVPDERPECFWRKRFQREVTDSDKGLTESSYVNTLLGLIDRHP
jgi:hypothetical protein